MIWKRFLWSSSSNKRFNCFFVKKWAPSFGLSTAWFSISTGPVKRDFSFWTIREVILIFMALIDRIREIVIPLSNATVWNDRTGKDRILWEHSRNFRYIETFIFVKKNYKNDIYKLLIHHYNKDHFISRWLARPFSKFISWICLTAWTDTEGEVSYIMSKPTC